MDPRQIKPILKQINNAIKSKEIGKALALCREILKVDSRNYMALVMFGVALQESELKKEALEAFRKAIEISPNQPLAWQGLASYYEKEKENSAIELLPVYQKILSLEKDAVKKQDILQKVKNLIPKITNIEVAAELAPFLLHEELRNDVAEALLRLCLSTGEISQKKLDFLIQWKKELFVFLETKTEFSFYVENYLHALYTLKYYHQFLNDFKTFEVWIIDNSQCAELLCKIYCELSTTNVVPEVDDISKHYNLLLTRNRRSFVGLLTKGVASYYSSDDYVGCRDILLEAADIIDDDWVLLYYLSKIYLKLYCFEDAINYAISATKTLPSEIDENVLSNINYLLLESLSKAGTVNAAQNCIELCEKKLIKIPDDKMVVRCLIRASIILEKFDVAEKELQCIAEENADAEVLHLKAILASKRNDVKRAISIMDGIPEELPFLDCWLLLGILYWESEDYTNAVNCFFRAGKLVPYVYIAFLYLGHYYRNVVNDLEKAKRCYEKAFQLNQKSADVAFALSDIYTKLNYKEDNLNLLNAISHNANNKSAWLRLGLYYLDIGDAKLAVKYLRSIARVHSNDRYCWVALGDAYFARGSFVSALKSYEKCLECDSSLLYPRLQISAIKQRIGLAGESIEECRLILNGNTDYLPALKGLAEAYYHEAKELFDKELLCCARDLCEEAALTLSKALKLNNKFQCFWKLFGDVCTLVVRLPEKYSHLTLCPSLFEKNLNETNPADVCIVRRDRLLNFALRSYQAAAYLSGKDENVSSFLWHDIAYCYDLLANLATDSNEKENIRKHALLAAKQSISLNPKVWQSWNLLGVIASSDEINNEALTQHCFVKAIKLESSNVVSWSNLGVLYLRHNDIQLANEAFQNAQRVDPKYSRSWIGQAIIAESVDYTETVDLFYHAVGLGFHPESAIGFAEWVCKILKNWDDYKENHHCFYLIRKMFALQVATTVLTWYTVRNPDDACASNILSILFELGELHRSAVSTSQKSLEIVPLEYADLVRTNYGRQLRKLGEYKQAIEIYEGVKEVDFVVQCDLALTLFLAGRHEEASNCYETAIHWLAPNDVSIAQAMIAQAAVTYLNGKKDAAKTILFQCIQLKPVPVYGLFAACAFGILNAQLTLSKLVLKELESFKYQIEYIPHIALFSTYCEVFQCNFKLAVRILSKILFAHPGNAALWLSSSFLLLNLICSPDGEEFLKCSRAAAYHAKCALTLGRGSIDVSKIYSIMSVSYLISGDAARSLKSSMKAVYLYPNVAENWAVLIAVCYSRGDNYVWLRQTIQYVRDRLNCSKTLKVWLTNMEKKINAIVG